MDDDLRKGVWVLGESSLIVYPYDSKQKISIQSWGDILLRFWDAKAIINKISTLQNIYLTTFQLLSSPTAFSSRFYSQFSTYSALLSTLIYPAPPQINPDVKTIRTIAVNLANFPFKLNPDLCYKYQLMFVLEKIKNYFSRPKDEDINASDPIKFFQEIMSEANNPSEDRISYGYISELEVYYLAVFDGHGGSKVSSYLQQNIKSVVTRVLRHYNAQSQNFDEAVQTSFQSIFKILEEDILQIMNREAVEGSSQFQDCGSCALLAIVTKTHVHIGNVGDSQGLIINSNPENSSVTNSQLNTKSPTQLQKLRHKFPQDKQLFVNHNNTLYVKGKINLTSSIGDFSLKYKKPDRDALQSLKVPYVSHTPDIRNYEIYADDRYLLLASDGLWEILTPSIVSEIILNNPKHKCLEILVQKCYQKCAEKNNMRISEILEHKKKRKFIDDISIVLLDLSQNN